MRAALSSKPTSVTGYMLVPIFQTNDLQAPLSPPSLAMSMQGRKCEGSSPSLAFGVFVIEVLSYFALLAEGDVRARAVDPESRVAVNGDEPLN